MLWLCVLGQVDPGWESVPTPAVNYENSGRGEVQPASTLPGLLFGDMVHLPHKGPAGVTYLPQELGLGLMGEQL